MLPSINGSVKIYPIYYRLAVRRNVDGHITDCRVVDRRIAGRCDAEYHNADRRDVDIDAMATAATLVNGH